MAFPSSQSVVYYNEEGEPLGWDTPHDDPPDPDDYPEWDDYDYDEEGEDDFDNS